MFYLLVFLAGFSAGIAYKDGKLDGVITWTGAKLVTGYLAVKARWFKPQETKL